MLIASTPSAAPYHRYLAECLKAAARSLLDVHCSSIFLPLALPGMQVASGNGEQVLSREIRRLGHSLDFMRLMSWYHTGNGFFINTAVTMLSVHATVWVVLLMSFLQERNAVIQNWISAVQLLQLGTLSVVVYWITLVLDAGLFWSVWIIIRQVFQGMCMAVIQRTGGLEGLLISFVANKSLLLLWVLP